MHTNCSRRPNSWEDCDAGPVIVNQKWSGQSKIVGGAARWTADELDGQMTFISAHLPHKGKKLGEFEAVLMEIQGIREWRVGGRLQREPARQGRPLPCGRVDPKTKKAGRHERLTARESCAHDGGRTGPDGDKHVDERRYRTRAFHTIQSVKPRRPVDTNGISS